MSKALSVGMAAIGGGGGRFAKVHAVCVPRQPYSAASRRKEGIVAGFRRAEAGIVA
jgi:hypothetical protein